MNTGDSDFLSTVKFCSYEELYYRIIHHLETYGYEVSERNGEVKCKRSEMITYSVDTLRAKDPFFFIPKRKWSLKLVLAEIEWMLEGSFRDLDKLIEYAPALKEYLNPERDYFWAQYGSRLMNAGLQENLIHDTNLPVINQIEELANKVKVDDNGLVHANRRLVANIWSPFLDNIQGEKDYPCNVMLIFEIDTLNPNGQSLNMTVIRRSNDLIYGIQNNFAQFWSFMMRLIVEIRKKNPQAKLNMGQHTEVNINPHVYVKGMDEKYHNARESVVKWAKKYKDTDGSGIQMNDYFTEPHGEHHTRYFRDIRKIQHCLHDDVKELDHILNDILSVSPDFIYTNIYEYLLRAFSKSLGYRRNHEF
jgi:thymidylate synthase